MLTLTCSHIKHIYSYAVCWLLFLFQVSELYVAHQGEFGTAEETVKQALKKISKEAQWSDVNLPSMKIWLDNHLPFNTNTTELN